VKKKKMRTKTLRPLLIALLVVLSAMVALAMPVGASDLNYDPTGSDSNPMSSGTIPCSYVCPAPDNDIYTISVPSPCGVVCITVRDAFWEGDRYEVWVDGKHIGTTPDVSHCHDGSNVYSSGTFRVILTGGAHTLQFKNTCEPCFTGSAPCYNGWLPSGFYYKVEIKDTWADLNEELDELIEKVDNAPMPNIIKQRLIGKLEYAKELKDNAKEEYEDGNVEAAKKKLGVAKNQVESFESMVRITRRISSEDKESFLAESAKIITKIDKLIEKIQIK